MFLRATRRIRLSAMLRLMRDERCARRLHYADIADGYYAEPLQRLLLLMLLMLLPR